MNDKKHHQILIVGGGTAGISVASRLRKKSSGYDVAIIEPSEKHYYQPLWTLVGGGVFPKEQSARFERECIPSGVSWIKDAVVEFVPEQNMVRTGFGKEVTYDYLVVCPGIQINWNRIKGLQGNMGQGGICSNYSYETVDSTWENIKNFSGGTAIFTQPVPPIKCGGAPQKICYLAEDYFTKAGIREKCEVIFATAEDRIFPIDKYAKALDKVVERKHIIPKYKHNLVEIKADLKEAVFENLEDGSTVSMKYDMIHVTPPMGAPDFIKESPLSDAQGWVDVDSDTLRHRQYQNIYGIGDATNLPTSKTGAAIRKQAPVLVENLDAQIRGKIPFKNYDGYTSCPLVTGYGKLILAEFDYDKQPKETFPFDQSRERYSMYLLKAYGLPQIYWHGMLKGRF